MKHNLQLKLSQHLALTPQLQQSIRLLQLSTLELSQELEQMLQDNPLLEIEAEDERGGLNGHEAGEAAAVENSREQNEAAPAAEPADNTDLADLDWNDYTVRGDDEDDGGPDTPTLRKTLREHLLEQLTLSPLEGRDRLFVSFLIDALNDDGYLTLSLKDVLETLPADWEAEPEELDIALKHLQHLDPTGVGARDLGECLNLQLRALPEDTPGRAAALAITARHLNLLANRDVGKLKRALQVDDAGLRLARDLILSLNPRPGANFGSDETQYVVPDVNVKKVKGLWLAALNSDAMPKLRINRVYADILARHRDSGSGQLNAQLQEAKWLIKNVQQRFDTILRVSQAIVDRQRQFLEHGEVSMRPLVLREIAETVGLHESTVSRVTTQKFMMTPRGIFELKYFFGSHVATESGGACSSTAIRALIKQMVDAEDAKTPLSDGQLADILSQQGIMVARRTVAKYRDALQIPPANMRKAV